MGMVYLALLAAAAGGGVMVGEGAWAADRYYLASAALYLLVRHLLPALLLAVQRSRCENYPGFFSLRGPMFISFHRCLLSCPCRRCGRSAPSGGGGGGGLLDGVVADGPSSSSSSSSSLAHNRFSLPECRANLHSARSLLAALVFYLTLALAVASEFPARWRAVLAAHLYVHLLADLLLLLPAKVAFAAACCCCCRRGSARGTGFFSSLHPGTTFKFQRKRFIYRLFL